MSHAVGEMAWGLKENLLKNDDVDEELIGKCLYTGNSNPPDLLIRTSGEVRMSDFLLWQTSYCTIYFTRVLWPDFSLWDLCKAVMHYQKNLPTIEVKCLKYQFYFILSINVIPLHSENFGIQ